MSTRLYVLRTGYDSVEGVFTTVENAAHYLARQVPFLHGVDLFAAGTFIDSFLLDVGEFERPQEIASRDIQVELQRAFNAATFEPAD